MGSSRFSWAAALRATHLATERAFRRPVAFSGGFIHVQRLGRAEGSGAVLPTRLSAGSGSGRVSARRVLERVQLALAGLILHDIASARQSWPSRAAADVLQ